MKLENRFICLALVIAIAIIPIMAACAPAPPAEEVGEWKLEKPIKIIVPYGPGGTYDLTTRMIASEMSKSLGQSVYIENVPGGGGVKGATIAYKAAPDGYTLLFFGSIALILGQYAYGGEYDWQELEYLAQAQDSALGTVFFVASTKNGLKTWEDVLKLDRPVRFASAGGATVSGLAARVTAKAFVLDDAIFMDGFKGLPEAMLAVIRGEADACMMPAIHAKEYIISGDLSVVLWTSGTPMSDFPPEEVDWLPQDVPWVLDMGHPEIIDALRNQHMLIAPPNTPQTVLDALSKSADTAVRSEALQGFYKKTGYQFNYAPSSNPEEIKRGVEKTMEAIKPFIALLKS